MIWKNQFFTNIRETDVQLLVTQITLDAWRWEAWDVEDEGEEIFSPQTTYGSHEEAQRSAEDWYNSTWLPHFQETGERLLE